MGNYKLFATVQSILNEWRGKGNLDLTTRAKYEESIVDWLSRSTEKQVTENAEIDPLIQRLMYQKFESKYSDQLSDSQKKILECSILGGTDEFVQIIKEIKKNALEKLKKFERMCDNALLKEGIGDVRERITSLPEEKTDEVISKTLHLVHLIEEMSSDE